MSNFINMYSFYFFGGPLNVRTKIPIHCSLAKGLGTESLLFLFSKKDEFIFLYTFYKYSVFFFYYTCNKYKIFFDFELL